MRTPPGQTTEIDARRVLVVAPHFDDEVLGCGGLLATLIAGGTEVRILFLSDGGGGVEEIEDREAYRKRRREEAEAVSAYLGFAGTDDLDLPDGQLELRVPEVRDALEARILEHRPHVLLVPSPLEVTPDHRAAFAAVYELLAPVRGEGELAAAVAHLDVLAYEVNHPFYPDLLVDVGPYLGTVAAAMERYGSQQERHDYFGAYAGLRRYRTLTLAPEVAAAEGYVRLSLEDFKTHSLAQLVRRLGGAPQLASVTEGPKISVIVRTLNRPELLAEALESLAESTYRNAEVVLVNDGGVPPTVPEDFPLPVQRVDLPETRGRSGAANAGVAVATGAYVTFLDDDDLAAPEHLETLVELASAAGVRIAYTDAAVGVYELSEDGWSCVERRLPYSRDFDLGLLRLDNYIPFNTLVFDADVLKAAGPFDESLPFFEDWEMLIRLGEKHRFHHLSRVTCEYRHFRGGSHHVFGEDPRKRADFLEVKARILERQGEVLTPDLLVRAVDRLRAEAVAQGEAAVKRGRHVESLERLLEKRQWLIDQREKEILWRAGEVDALKGDRARFQQAFEETREAYQAKAEEEGHLRETLAEQDEHLKRTYAEIERLGGELAEHGEHLGRTYAEIERLTGLIEQMKQTRAWRVHQWIEEKRGRGR